jgi:hypothetical protein
MNIGDTPYTYDHPDISSHLHEKSGYTPAEKKQFLFGDKLK